MRMLSNSKYLGVLLTFLILNTAVGFPTKEKVECEILSDLYPPNSHVAEILQICKTSKLLEPILSYCEELVRVQNNVSSCGLGQLLQHVPDNVHKDIVSMSLAAPVTEEPICNVFQSNATLYRLYIDKPGFAKQLSTRTFCPMFCEKYKDYCKLLLRTYWVKKVLVELSQDIPRIAADNSGTPGKVAANNSGIPGKVAVDNSGIPGKVAVDNSGTPKKVATDNSGVLEKVATDNSGIPGRDAAVNSGIPGKVSSVNSDIPGKVTSVNSDLLVSSTTANLPQETKQDVTKKSTSLPTSKAKQTTIGGQNMHKPGIEHIPSVSVEKGKSPEIAVVAPVSSNLELQPDKGIDTSSRGNDKDIIATNNEKPKLNGILVEKKPIDNNNSKNYQSPDDESKAKVKNDNNDGGETKSQPDDSINIDGHIPFDPDRVISDDLATTMEKGTEFGNQIHDFGDGYGEQANEYQDNSQDGPEAAIPVETAQTDFKDNVADNLQSDEASVGKQTNSVPQLPAFPDEEDGHFFAYFLTIVVFCIAGYLVFHNKQKIIALIVEGRHERRRRPNNGAYKRLDSKDNTKATSHVIF